MDQLPVWLTLRGRGVLVVGGGLAATAKARLALAAGARVTMVAPSLVAEAMELATAGEIRHFPREFIPSDLDGHGLVYGATGDEAQDCAVADAARARGGRVYNDDQPALSDFSMPAIVDRSPVVVGISTGGAVPALAVAVRQRIEAALPVRLGKLAAFAESFRSTIKAKIADAPARLRFWQRIVAGPLAEHVLAGKEDAARAELMRALNNDASAFSVGTVYLVGAGPGDPELLTLRAVRLLQSADVILYDRLVGTGALEYARRDAERVFVGKEPTRHPISQQGINDILVDRARRGLNVVRLKGGDPFIFGRGGEEADHLRAAGVPVQVVPGITAALACAAEAGVPLTHRDHAMEVTFVTGHGRDGSGAEPDWRALARARHTLVVYMGVGHAAEIAAKLTANGLPASTPVAVIQNGTQTNQRIVGGTIGRLGALVVEQKIENPALLIVGEVARAAQTDAGLTQEFLRAVAS